MSSISAENKKHSHCNQHDCNASATMQQHVLHAEFSEHDKAYFTEDIISPGKGLKKIAAKVVLNSSQRKTSNKENFYHLDVATFCNGLDH